MHRQMDAGRVRVMSHDTYSARQLHQRIETRRVCSADVLHHLLARWCPFKRDALQW
jgi:hypothetical protein